MNWFKKGFMLEKDAHIFYSQNRNQGLDRTCCTQQVSESTFGTAHVDLGSTPLTFSGPILLEHEPLYGAHLGRVTQPCACGVRIDVIDLGGPYCRIT